MSSVSKTELWAELLLYYGILVFCATIPFSIGFATGGLFGGTVGWALRCALRRQWCWKRSALDGVILIFLATQVWNVFFSMDRVRSLDELRSYWHLMAFFLLVQGDLDKRRLGVALNTMIAGAVFSAGMGIWQFLGHVVSGTPGDAPRVSGAFGMYMTFAGILAMVWGLGLFQAVRPELSRRDRILYLGALIIISFALGLSMTRTAMLAVGIAVGLLLLMRYPKTVCALAAAAIVLTMAIPSARQQARSTFWGDQVAGMDTNVMLPWADQRPYLWKGAWRILKDKPWTGVGLANFRLAYKDYLPYKLEKTYHHAHNNLLHLGAETGVPGLFAFCLMMLAALLVLIRGYLRAPPGMAKAVLGGVLAAFLGFHVAGVFEYNFGDSEVSMLFWSLLALAVLARKAYPAQEAA